MKNNNDLIIIFGGIFIILIVLLIPNNKLNNIDDYNKCNNMQLEDTAICLHNYVKSIFKYKITDDNIKLTLDDLIEKGGDCRNWNMLYEKMGNDLNYYSYSFHIENNKTGHRFAIISNEEGYCLLDQLIDPICIFFNNLEGDNNGI